MSDFLATALITNAGGRSYNEDCLLYASAGECTCWVLADGLGGHGGGETAARVACSAALASFRANPVVSSMAVMEHLQAADRAVRLEQALQPALARMRTTMVILVSSFSAAVWGHVGDSRLYHLRSGRVCAQTKDHSLPQTLADAGEIRQTEIRRHADRNRLLRVLGEEEPVQPAVLPSPVGLLAGDAFLLCTDGFWENVVELEMELDFAKSRLPQQWLDLMETRLQERVSGSHDNYSAIAVTGDRLPGPFPSLPQGRRTTTAAAPRKSGRAMKSMVLAMLVVVCALAGANAAAPVWRPRAAAIAAKVRKLGIGRPLVNQPASNGKTNDAAKSEDLRDKH